MYVCYQSDSTRSPFGPSSVDNDHLKLTDAVWGTQSKLNINDGDNLKSWNTNRWMNDLQGRVRLQIDLSGCTI